jgi:hypothetical protein
MDQQIVMTPEQLAERVRVLEADNERLREALEDVADCTVMYWARKRAAEALAATPPTKPVLQPHLTIAAIENVYRYLTIALAEPDGTGELVAACTAIEEWASVHNRTLPCRAVRPTCGAPEPSDASSGERPKGEYMRGFADGITGATNAHQKLLRPDPANGEPPQTPRMQANPGCWGRTSRHATEHAYGSGCDKEPRCVPVPTPERTNLDDMRDQINEAARAVQERCPDVPMVKIPMPKETK